MNEDLVLPRRGTVATEGECLLGALRELCEESADRVPGEEPPNAAQCDDWPSISMLNKEEEQFVARLRADLARLADARRGEPGEGAAAVGWVLDGAQLAARSELLIGEAGQLRQLLAGFVYLVVLAVADPAEALAVSERAVQLMR